MNTRSEILIVSAALAALAPALPAQRPADAETANRDLALDVKLLKEEIASLRRENTALREEIKALKTQAGPAELEMLRRQLAEARTRIDQLAPGKPPTPASQPQAKPIGLAELLAAGRRYLAAPPNETQAAADQRRQKITAELIGRTVRLRGTLQDVAAEKGGKCRASLSYASAREIEYEDSYRVVAKMPAESFACVVGGLDEAAAGLPRGSQVTAQGLLKTIRFRPGAPSAPSAPGAIHIELSIDDGKLTP